MVIVFVPILLWACVPLTVKENERSDEDRQFFVVFLVVGLAVVLVLVLVLIFVRRKKINVSNSLLGGRGNTMATVVRAMVQ